MSVHPEVTIGHVHLTVADLERSLGFYRDLLGFEITAQFDTAVFLSAGLPGQGGYHHHIGLNTWAGTDARPAPRGHTGLYHFAILFPSRKEIARVLRRLIQSGYPITGTADHGVSEAVYLDDPDGNGVELYVDRPRSEWIVNNDGKVEMITAPLDLEDLLAQADE